MLFILVFSYLAKTGKIKRQVNFVKSLSKRFDYKFLNAKTAIIMGLIILEC